MSDLPANIHAKITRLSALGDEAQSRGDYAAAILHYDAAFASVPEPYQDWEASTWILVALGETYFFMGDFAKAAQNLTTAMHCPGGLGNAFVHFRLGQVQLELNNAERARDELMRAYMGAGSQIFAGEDPKYFAFLKPFIKA
jgi:tetratricopeptide (TPR) repeat protein